MLTLKPRMINIKMDHDFIPVVTVEFVVHHEDTPTMRRLSEAEYGALMKLLGEIKIETETQA